MPPTDLVRPDGQPALEVEHLTIRVVDDPLRTRHGFPISSPYVEMFWLSHLGPSAVCLLRLADRLTDTTSNRHATLAVEHLATMIGTPGSTRAVHRRLDRLVRFGAASWTTTGQSELTVWSHIDTVPVRLQARWPEWLRQAHDHAIAERAGR